ncbi:unnamed protein product [Chrysoparadoxa australica]
MAVEGCIQDCVHEWFGGNGECIENSAGEAECVCSLGYLEEDEFGHPSCVKETAASATHIFIIVMALATIVHAIYHFNRQYSILHKEGYCKGGKNASKNLPPMEVLRIRGFTASMGWGILVTAIFGTVIYTGIGLPKIGILLGLAFGMCACGLMTTAHMWLQTIPLKLSSQCPRASYVRRLSDDHGVIEWTSLVFVVLFTGWGILAHFRMDIARYLFLCTIAFLTTTVTVLVYSVAVNLYIVIIYTDVAPGQKNPYQNMKRRILTAIFVDGAIELMVVAGVITAMASQIAAETPLYLFSLPLFAGPSLWFLVNNAVMARRDDSKKKEKATPTNSRTGNTAGTMEGSTPTDDSPYPRPQGAFQGGRAGADSVAFSSVDNYSTMRSMHSSQTPAGDQAELAEV